MCAPCCKGFTESRETTAPTGVPNVTAVAAGLAHTCAVLADGAVKCWGNNKGGQVVRDSSVTFLSELVLVDGL